MAVPPLVSARSLVDDALAVVHTLAVAEALALHGRDDVLFVDLREPVELAREGRVPGAFHAPRGVIEFWADPTSEWHRPELGRAGVRLVLYCAIGWRSALAARALQEMGIPQVSHLGGGFAGWQAAGGPVATAG